eukprot:6205937-Pleurochrysis_carterae.AAC.4
MSRWEVEKLFRWSLQSTNDEIRSNKRQRARSGQQERTRTNSKAGHARFYVWIAVQPPSSTAAPEGKGLCRHSPSDVAKVNKDDKASEELYTWVEPKATVG